MNFIEKLYSDAFEEGFRLAIKYYTFNITRGPVNRLKNKIDSKSTAQKIDERFNSLLEKYSNKPVKSLLSKKSSYWA